jgi:hypothetical protein
MTSAVEGSTFQLKSNQETLIGLGAVGTNCGRPAKTTHYRYDRHGILSLWKNR